MSSISNLEENAVKTYGAEMEKTNSSARKTGNYGKTIGQPKLSDKAAKYYEELKKKFSNMDFILVSADQKAVQLSQMKKDIGSNSSVKGFGMQVNDNGTTSFFAVVDKSLAAQRERIAKRTAEKKETAKKDAKRAEKKKQAEALEESRKSDKTESDYVTVTASSIDELKKKVDNVLYAAWSDLVRTDEERLWGQNIDFRL